MKRLHKTQTNFIAIVFGLLTAVASHADGGSETGNGGGAWACFSGANALRWVRLVDLYEAQTEFQLQIPTYSSSLGYSEILDLNNARLFRAVPDFFAKIVQYEEEVRSSMVFVNADLKIIDDALYRIIPTANECSGGEIRYIQVANYTNYGKVLVQNTIWNSPLLSEIDKAALIFHEAVYRYARENYGDINSSRSRQIVGHVFSKLDIASLKETLQKLIGSGTQDPNPPAPKQKYFEAGEFHHLSKRNISCGEPSSGLLVLDGGQNSGWTIQLGVRGTGDCVPSTATIELKRKIGQKTWTGDGSVTARLSNGTKCTYPVSVQVTFNQGKKGNIFLPEGSYFEISASYPAVYQISTQCDDALTGTLYDYRDRVPLGE